MKDEEKVEIDILEEAIENEEIEFTKTIPKLVVDNELKETEDSIDYTLSISREEFYGKEDKKKLPIIIILLIILFVVFAYVGIKFLDIKIGETEKEEKKVIQEEIKEPETKLEGEEKSMSDYNEEYGAIYFYQDNSNKLYISKIIVTNDTGKKYLGVYNCTTSDCNIYLLNNESYYSLENKTILVKDGKGFIFNYGTNKIVTDSYINWYKINNSYLLAVDNVSNIYSNRGTNVTKDNFDTIGKIKGSSLQGISGNFIIVSKDSKYGVINFEDGKIEVEVNYEDIRIEKNNIFLVKENGKWHTIIKSTLSSKGYDEVILATLNYVMVIDGTNFDIVDIKGESLINESIEAPKDYTRDNPKNFEMSDVEGSTVVITINEEVYRFNVNTFSIIKYSL